MGLRSPSAQAAGPVVEVPGSIDDTGERDVTVELNALFGSAAPGTTIRFPEGGRYRVEGIVLIEARANLTVEGNGASLVAKTDGRGLPAPFRNYGSHWPRMREHVEIRRSSEITIKDLTVVGPNPSGRYVPELEAQAGFVIRSSRGVTLDGVAVRDTYGDGVYIVGQSFDIVITDCTLDHNGRQGVAVVAGQTIEITKCTISDTGRSSIDLEPARGQVRDVHITDNQVRNPTNFLLAAVGAGAGVQDVWLERNRVSGGKGVSVYVGTERSMRTEMHIIDNVGTGVSAGYEGTLLRFERFDGIEVRGNRQRVASGVTPIRLIDSCNDTVTGNDFGSAGSDIRREGDCATPLPVGRRNPAATTNPVPNAGARRPLGSTPRRTTTTSSVPAASAPAVDGDSDDDLADRDRPRGRSAGGSRCDVRLPAGASGASSVVGVVARRGLVGLVEDPSEAVDQPLVVGGDRDGPGPAHAECLDECDRVARHGHRAGSGCNRSDRDGGADLDDECRVRPSGLNGDDAGTPVVGTRREGRAQRGRVDQAGTEFLVVTGRLDAEREEDVALVNPRVPQRVKGHGAQRDVTRRRLAQGGPQAIADGPGGGGQRRVALDELRHGLGRGGLRRVVDHLGG